MGRGLWAVATLIALGGITSSAFAQVEYVRELIGTSGLADDQPLLNITQGPVYTSDPSYSNTPTQTIISQTREYQVNSATGLVSGPSDLPDGVLLAPNSIGSIVGQGSTQRYFYLMSAQGDVLTINYLANTVVYVPPPSLDFFAIAFHSMAAQSRDSAEISFITTGFGGVTSLTLVNRETGVGTATSVMSHLGTEAFYQSYGADGLLYILDYGNDRMVSFDPANDFAQIGTFDLNTSIATANEQFAIGRNGNFYLGDGLGGGSTYAADGTYLGSFALPDGVVGDPYTGASYLSSDSAGRVYVYDAQTGFHQYQDTSVVPEPSTYALAIGTFLGALILRRRKQAALAAFIALCGIASSAFAQVDYVQAIPVPAGAAAILPIVQAPYVTGNPAVTNELPPLVTATSQYYTLNPTTGLYSIVSFYPPNVKLNANSLVTWLGQNSVESGPTMLFATPQHQLVTFDVRADRATSFPVISGADYEIATSMAARSLNDPISLIADSEHYAVDRLTGVATLQPLAGVDTATTKFMSYGADGLLYVLDYGNSRIASFDPDDAFAPISSFTLETGVTTANMQFAIGINGSFYLADGLGGGSYYNSLGQFQGVFTLPGDATTSTYNGQSYITTGADGSVYVYDKNYGFQEYKDTSVVPEPSTYALAIGTLLGALILRRRWQRTLAAFIALCGIASSAFAQVEYVRAIPVPGSASAVLPIVQAPYVTGEPAVTNELPPLAKASAEYYILNPTTGLYSIANFYPPNVILNANSRLSWIGQNSAESGPTMLFITPQRLVITVDVRADMVTSNPRMSVEYETASSMAARSLNDPVSLIADSEHYAVDRLTGVATLQPLAGVDTATTKFMSYGADGLLYVLDYGNNRIASFDPDDAFAPIGSFTLETGVTTANMQFAIGINGSFYLADGLGGGSYYDSQGAFQGVFNLPGDATTSTYNGQSYLTTGADGSVYVYDKGYGFQQYQDTSVVPEPSTYALAIGGLLGALILRRRWQGA
ncbi:hypothetical protein BH09VER1_BH09VER1_09660 [soil metagenome]